MPITFGGGIFGGGGGVSGSGASGRLALWSGAGTLTSDAGLTYSGTGDTGVLKLGALGDLSLSRSAAGVLAVGTGAAGSTAGTLLAGAFSTRGSINTGTHIVTLGTSGTQYASLTASGLWSATQGIGIGTYGSVKWGSTIDPERWHDLFLTRRAAATLQLGDADSATPVAQTIAFQGATGTNVAGQDATFQGSLGTGTGAAGKLVFKVGTPTGTGSTQHTANTVLTLQDTGTGGTAASAVVVAAKLGVGVAPTETLTVQAADNSVNQVAFGIVGERKGALYHDNANGLILYGSSTAGSATPVLITSGGSASADKLLGFSGGVATFYNGAATTSGAVLASVVVTPNTGTATPAATDSRTVYTNEGDADGSTVTLPAAAAGLQYTAIVQAAQTLTITAATGNTIRIGSSVTATGGSITNSAVGATVTLTAINATEWVATSTVGTAWTF